MQDVLHSKRMAKVCVQKILSGFRAPVGVVNASDVHRGIRLVCVMDQDQYGRVVPNNVGLPVSMFLLSVLCLYYCARSRGDVVFF
jgi:hypothetical protein